MEPTDQDEPPPTQTGGARDDTAEPLTTDVVGLFGADAPDDMALAMPTTNSASAVVGTPADEQTEQVVIDSEPTNVVPFQKRVAPSKSKEPIAIIGLGRSGGELNYWVRPSQAERLIRLAEPSDLFHAPDGEGFAQVIVAGHRETWPIQSKDFRHWLASRLFEETGRTASSGAMRSALDALEGKATFLGPERAVHSRVGRVQDRLYLDLTDEAWRAVEIDSFGWRVVENPPIAFRRRAGMQPLAAPVRGGSVDSLRSFLNLTSEDDFVLTVAWLLACFRERGPYPVLAVSGEQGSAKSTFSAMLRALVDPNAAPLRALPREDRDFFIAASNAHVLAFDNVSSLSPAISDTLCRLATGGGSGGRQLRTDRDEVLFQATRPVILNGIDEIITRSDLADRTIFLVLEPINEDRRRTDAELWTEFEIERPRILGALLDAVAAGQKRLPETRLEKLPRLADFALWATACEPGLWPAGTFEAAYRANREDAVADTIDADPVAGGIRNLMANRGSWLGTASDLVAALGDEIPPRVATPQKLGMRIRRAMSILRTVGINVKVTREGHVRTRVIQITATDA